VAHLKVSPPHWPLGVSLSVALTAVLLLPGAMPWGLSTEVPSDTPPYLTANATASPVAGPIPLTVMFVAHAAQGMPPYSYNWSFGDRSANATTEFANHTFRSIGTYQVNLTVGDSVGELVTTSLSINATPDALAIQVSANPAALSAGATTLLSTTVTGGLAPFRYNWSGLPEGCPPQTVQNLSCTPLYGGSYVVRVTVTDARDVSATSTVALLVSGPGPRAPPGPAPPAPDYTDAIFAVVGVGAIAVIAAALVGRRARRRSDGPKP